MDITAFRRAGHDAVERIARYYEELHSNSIAVTVPSEPGSLRKHIPKGPPLEGENFDTITQDFDRIILPGCTHWQHPAFFGFFPANSSFESIIADMYSSAVNNPGFNWACSPIPTDLEYIVMDWIACLLGLSEKFKSTSKTGGGNIMGTASEAFLTMCVAARERAVSYLDVGSPIGPTSAHLPGQEPNGFIGNSDKSSETARGRGAGETKDHGKFMIYGSGEAHSMGAKAAKVLGLTWKSIVVTGEDGWKLTGKALRKNLEEDVSNSLIPCMLIVSIGATNLGTSDCLDELLEVARDYPSLWVHVDAAWAGTYLSLEECRHELHLEAINDARLPKHLLANGNAKQKSYYSQQPPGIVHSFCTNLHKSGLVSTGCSPNFVYNKYLVIDAIQQGQPALESSEGNTDRALDLRNWEIPLGRPFRSLKVYFALRSYGIKGFQGELRRTINTAQYFESLIQSSDVFEMVVPRSLSLVVFRINTFKGASKKDVDRNIEKICSLQSKKLSKRLETTHQIFLTACTVSGKFCLRLAIGRMTHKKHIDDVWKVISECAGDILREWQGTDSQKSCIAYSEDA